MKKNNQYYHELRIKSRQNGRENSRSFDRDYMFGCILYWTEGSKGKHVVDFTNSDPIMMKYFINFLRKYFCVDNSKITIYINAYLTNGMDIGKIQTYWVDMLDLPTFCLRKFTNREKYYDPNNKRKKNVHPYGICKLRVNDSSIVEEIFGAIEEEFKTTITLR